MVKTSNGKNLRQLSRARAHARTRCTAFQDLLFVKMVRSDDGDDATTATDPRVGFRFVYFFFVSVSTACADGWMSIDVKDRPGNFGFRD